MAALSSELLAGKLAEAISGRIVRAEGLVVRVLGIRGDLLRHLPHLVRERVVMRRVLQERLDPALRAVVVRHVVIEEQLAEEQTAANVGEGPEREYATRRLDELRDLGVLVDDLLDDRADRLVDQRDPKLVVLGHRPNYGCFARARHAICAAVRIRSTANSFRSTCS